MESKCNGKVTYKAMQRLIERYCDEGENTLVWTLSAAMDSICCEQLAQEDENGSCAM